MDTMDKSEESVPYILGIDLGSASIGWAVLTRPSVGENALLTTGVRVFDPGVTGEIGDIEAGKDEARGKARRQARQSRRQTWRRAWRMKKLFRDLQSAGLLPPTAPGEHRDEAAARYATVEVLDRELRVRWLTPERPLAVPASASGAGASPALQPAPAPEHVLPYLLRARALDVRLEPFEIGRALYHLAQRRGFLSNRLTTPKEDEEEGQVREGISSLEAEMRQARARTLGEYFSRLDPREERIRRRWTARSMYEDEFDLIWKAQALHDPQLLTASLRKRVHSVIFYQRPLKSASALIGECEFEKGRRRAPWACLEAQRFRLLQKVNDLEVVTQGQRRLSGDERSALLAGLEARPDMKFAEIRKLLGLRHDRFNLEAGGEKRLKGNLTAAVMTRCFGDRWEAFGDEERARIVEEWRTIEKPETLVRRLVDVLGAAEPPARELSGERAPNGYCRLSRKALRKLLPLMEEGVQYMAAVDDVYGMSFSGGRVSDRLPPVRELLPQLRNPAVGRALTELRKVVNAIVHEYGKPAEIRVELGRDLRRPREERARIWRENRSRQDERERVRSILREEVGVPQPSRDDIDKYLLWQECGGFCPYTGRPISRDALFGAAPQFQIEHILPLSRFPDDSFQNKTLCYHEENARKKNQTPFEAYGADPDDWARILDRVGKFKNREKLKRFEMRETEAEELLQQFSSRQLNDTRYSAKVATQYLGALYGGRDVADSAAPTGLRRVVFTSTGQVTATLRREWRLNGVLPAPAGLTSPAEKSRHDHRQHAIDAIVTALATPAWVKRLSDRAAGNQRQSGRASFRGLEGPWPNFADSVREAVFSINVSHRPEHKLSGQLHKETNYGSPYERTDKGRTTLCANERKSLSKITVTEISRIVDPAVREAVERRLGELGGDLKKLQLAATPPRHRPARAAPEPPPFLKAHDGRQIPIFKVRIWQAVTPQKVGEGSRERQVALANNHHAEIFALLDEQGQERRWDAMVVSRLEAVRRKRGGQPLVQRDHGPSCLFKFSLMKGDTVEVDDNGKRALFVVRSISEGDIPMVRICDARRISDIKKRKEWLRIRSIDQLRQLNCLKVCVDALGRVRPAND